MSDADADFVQSIVQRVDEHFADAEQTELELTHLNGWKRLLLHQEIPLRRPDFETESRQIGNNKHVCFCFCIFQIMNVFF